MKRETWMQQGTKVSVGLFEGRIVRVVEFQGNIWIDVEIGGVIDRHLAENVTPVDEEAAYRMARYE